MHIHPTAKKYAAWGVGLAGLAIAAPALILAVKGLISLVVALTIGAVALAAAPVVSSLLAAWKLKGIKYIATKNPVEQLQLIYQDRVDALDEFRNRITQFATEVKTFEGKMREFALKYPAEAPKFRDQLTAMQQLLNVRRERYSQVKDQLAAFEQEIRKAQAIWDMSQAAQALNKAAGMSSDDVFAKIKAETAVDAIQRSLHQSFAELETALLDETPGKASAATIAPHSVAQTPAPVLAHTPSPQILAPTGVVNTRRPLARK